MTAFWLLCIVGVLLLGFYSIEQGLDRIGRALEVLAGEGEIARVKAREDEERKARRAARR